MNQVNPNTYTLEWQPPLSTGGSPIKGYLIEMTDAKGWRKISYNTPRNLKHNVYGLEEGESYFFRISAENEVGLSIPLQSDCLNIERVRRRQTPFELTPKRERIVLKWDEPTTYDRRRITGYIIEKQDTNLPRSDWQEIDRVGFNLRKYDVPHYHDKNYKFRVRPVLDTGVVDYIVKEEESPYEYNKRKRTFEYFL